MTDEKVLTFVERIFGRSAQAFAFLGLAVILWFVAKNSYFVFKNLFVFFFAERLGLTANFRKLGQWAVVTGATDGIGKGYAFELARRGCDIVLISRNAEKLRTVADEIESKFRVKTKIISVDFGGDEDIYDIIKSGIEGLEIGTLVNNVGAGYKYPEYFADVQGGTETFLHLIRLNIVSQTMMTRIVLPSMVARHKGAIISLSSGFAVKPYPLVSVYSAAKAYSDYLACALSVEYSNEGIISQSVLPFVVATNMSGFRKANLFIADPLKFARSALNTVGFFQRTHGHPSHAIQSWVLESIPQFWAKSLSLNMMQTIRAKALRKAKAKTQ